MDLSGQMQNVLGLKRTNAKCLGTYADKCETYKDLWRHDYKIVHFDDNSVYSLFWEKESLSKLKTSI